MWGFPVIGLLRAVWSAACLSAVAAVILSRSGFGAGLWLAVFVTVTIGFGAVLSFVGIVRIGRSFHAYVSEALTLGRFDHRLSRQTAVRFAGLQALGIGVLLWFASGSALVLPGLPVQAVFVTVFLTPSLWALQSLLMTRRVVGGALERLVSGSSQRGIADRLPFWRRPPVGWILAARVDLARRASGSDAAATAYLHALDSDGAVRPVLVLRGPSVMADAALRAVGVMPVVLASVPFALIAWACAAWLPDTWVPRLPSPGIVFGLEAPPASAAAPDPEVPSPDTGAADGAGAAAGTKGGQGAADAATDGAGDGGKAAATAAAGQAGEGRSGSGSGSTSGSGSGSTSTSGSGSGDIPEAGPAAGNGQAAAAIGPRSQGPGAGDAAQSDAGAAPGAGDEAAGAPPPAQDGSAAGDAGQGGGAAPQPPADLPAGAAEGAALPPDAGVAGSDAPASAEGGTAADSRNDATLKEPDAGAAGAAEGTGKPASVIPSGTDPSGPATDSAGTPQTAEIMAGPRPGNADGVAVAALDGTPPPDAALTDLAVSGAPAPVPGDGEDLGVGSQQARFAEPGRAPDAVETRLDDAATLPPDLPPGPAAQQRLPAWIAGLLDD